MSEHGTHAPATISFGMTRRIPGRILIVLENVPAGVDAWRVDVTTREGNRLPGRIVTTSDQSHVLVLPVVAATQIVALRAFDAAGALVAQGAHTVGRYKARLLSVAHRRKPTHVFDIIADDLVTADDRVSLGDFQIMHEDDDHFFFYTTLTVAQDRPGLEDVPIDLGVLDIDGTEISTGDVYVLSDDTVRYRNDPQASMRTIRYAVYVPYSCEGLIFWTRFPHRDFAENFWAIDPFGLENLKRDSVMTTFPAEAATNYVKWFLENRANSVTLAHQRREQEGFSIRPLFSVIIPLYHTPVVFFREAVSSVLEQSYPRIELILVNSTPDDAELADEVASIARKDARVRVVTLDGNKGITENTNAGIAVATGDFLSFMDHDDVIERDLFYWYVRGINDYPTTDLLFCDEDLLIDGNYTLPVFKPDWCLHFLETNNYVCHLLTVRRSIVNELPTPTREFDGAQDHNMTLEVGERARNVYHARRILYHWRSHPLSTAQNPLAKPESFAAGKLAIDNHYRRIGFDAHVESIPDWPHCYRTICTSPTRPSLSLVLWGDEPKGGAPDPRSLVEGWDADVVDVRLEGAQTWQQAVTEALDEATGEIVVLLHRAARPQSPAWLDGLVAFAGRSDCGVVAPRLSYANGAVFSLGIAQSRATGSIHMANLLSTDTRAGRGIARMAHDASAASPFCLVMRKSALSLVGIDGLALAPSMDAASIELCRRVRNNGMSVAIFPESVVVVPAGHEHIESNEEGLPEADHYYHQALSPDGHYSFVDGWKWIVIPAPVDLRLFSLKMRY